jgi:acetylornithine deacetylase/succinyl-diaminopimelate desuccinylase-like protein
MSSTGFSGTLSKLSLADNDDENKEEFFDANTGTHSTGTQRNDNANKHITNMEYVNDVDNDMNNDSIVVVHTNVDFSNENNDDDISLEAGVSTINLANNNFEDNNNNVLNDYIDVNINVNINEAIIDANNDNRIDNDVEVNDDDDDEYINKDRVTIDRLRDNIIAPNTYKAYSCEIKIFFKWMLENEPSWLTDYVRERLIVIFEVIPGEPKRL